MNSAQIVNRIKNYTVAYYDELRAQMEVYRDVAETFPDWLKGHKRVVAVLGVDGVVIVHWASDKDIFQFATAQKSLGEIANEYAGGISFDLPQGSKVGMEIAKPTIHQGTDTSGPLVWSSPWDRVELSSDTSHQVERTVRAFGS